MSGPLRWRDDPSFRAETGIDLDALDDAASAEVLAAGWARIEGAARAAVPGTSGPPSMGGAQVGRVAGSGGTQAAGLASAVLKVVAAAVLGGAMQPSQVAVVERVAERGSGFEVADAARPVVRIAMSPLPEPSREVRAGEGGGAIAPVREGLVGERLVPTLDEGEAEGERDRGAGRSRLAAEIASYELAVAAERAGRTARARHLYERHLVEFGRDGALALEVRRALERLRVAPSKGEERLEK